MIVLYSSIILYEYILHIKICLFAQTLFSKQYLLKVFIRNFEGFLKWFLIFCSVEHLTNFPQDYEAVQWSTKSEIIKDLITPILRTLREKSKPYQPWTAINFSICIFMNFFINCRLSKTFWNAFPDRYESIHMIIIWISYSSIHIDYYLRLNICLAIRC